MNINIEGIIAGYGHTPVLQDINWSVPSGVTGLLGPNGSGKSTLLSVIVGLLQPSKGTVTITDTATEARFGFVPQRFSIPGGMRLLDAIAYTAWMNGVPRRERDSAAHHALTGVDLTHEANAKVKTLSGGQRQRAGVAAGLVHDPDVLVLDEPTAGLDIEQRWRVRDLIAEIGRTRPVVVATHLLDDVTALCERVGVLAQGRLVFDGTVAELEASGHDQLAPTLRSPIEAGYMMCLATSGGAT